MRVEYQIMLTLGIPWTDASTFRGSQTEYANTKKPPCKFALPNLPVDLSANLNNWPWLSRAIRYIQTADKAVSSKSALYVYIWPLTLKYDRTTWPRLEIDIRHRDYSDMKTKGHDMKYFLNLTWDMRTSNPYTHCT